MKYLASMLAIGAALCANRADSQVLTTLVSFTGTSGTASGWNPLGTLTLSGITLYGMTDDGGVDGLGNVFSVGTDGSSFQNLVSFTGSSGSATGLHPLDSLTLSGTTLYGMTEFGGANSFGNIFSVGTDSTNYQNLVSFTGASGTAGGYAPEGNLALSGTTLYGMTSGGGANSFGNIFSVGADGTNYQNLISFTGASASGTASGLFPAGSLTLSGTTRFGMTSQGGGDGLGNVFSVAANGTNYQNLVSFTGAGGTASGSTPLGNITLSGTTLYGMTHDGGDNGDGNIFSVGADGTNYQNLISFTSTGGSANGLHPIGSLTLSGTTLYGTTAGGGARGFGSIFSVGIDGSDYRTLYSFNGGADGGGPEGDLTFSGSMVFGMTSSGGANRFGTVFALDLGVSTWASSSGGSWNTPSNWASGRVPNGIGTEVVFGNALTQSSTISLDGNQTVGSLTFNGTVGYTLAAGSGGTLTLDNGASGSHLLAEAGSDSITAPVTIAGGGLMVTGSNYGSLTIAGDIGDDNAVESLTLNGDGTGVLVLGGTNTYSGGTIVQNGTLVAISPYALPQGGNLAVGAEAGSIFAPAAAAAQADSSTVVPEPSTIVTLGLAAILLMQGQRRRRGKSGSAEDWHQVCHLVPESCRTGKIIGTLPGREKPGDITEIDSNQNQ